MREAWDGAERGRHRQILVERQISGWGAPLAKAVDVVDLVRAIEVFLNTLHQLGSIPFHFLP